MEKEMKGPSVKLGTLLMVIQILQKEIESLKRIETDSADDQLWFHDLEMAATDVEEAYTSYIKENNIINFPSYEKLVKPFKDEK